jgi:hypothetical protein
VGNDDKGRLEERVSLIIRITHSFEQFTPSPVLETVEEKLRPLNDGGIGPYLRSHGTILWWSGRKGTSYTPTSSILKKSVILMEG